MIFVRDNGPASAEALAGFESQLGSLPDDYREFITAHNGVSLSGTAQLRGPDKWPVETIEGIQDTEFWHEDYPKGSMPIGDDGSGNTYLMALTGELRGRIYFLDHELSSESQKPLGRLPLVADSFADFLARIQDFDPDDPEDKELFHVLAERRRKAEEQREAIHNAKKPWWRIW
ncbi:MAG TPA: SMI1/KNR4 family protein [Chthoniobacteraceae bacterium]|nr:SMI1/KNR4 family protein [Chthoniobacteraceae bacterium]